VWHGNENINAAIQIRLAIDIAGATATSELSAPKKPMSADLRSIFFHRELKFAVLCNMLVAFMRVQDRIFLQPDFIGEPQDPSISAPPPL